MKLSKLLLASCLLLTGFTSTAGDKIKYYFNHTVDNTVSTGVDAINLSGKIDDTLVAYINRAKYTLDVCVYNFTSTSSGLSNVANAINAAYSRGVKVRWIHNGTSVTANTGLTLINTAIPKLGSPNASGYNIMHNKFLVIDANSADPADAIVWTGSTNWSVQQFEYDYDNVVIFQDSALAHTYRAQFNMMWGDTGMTYNTATSKFGPDKTDMGRHNFIIDGKPVEVYFSPSDNTNNHIASTILTADKDLYFGLYVITDNTDADNIIARKNAGVYTAGILDAYVMSASGSEYTTLNSSLGSANLKVYNGGSYLYHNKYLIVDPSDACSDPVVLTGSHNWTFSANTQNDENTVIIHDATAANIYYQSFKADFASLGGTLTKIYGCTSGIGNVTEDMGELLITPQPSVDGVFNMSLNVNGAQTITMQVTDMQGRVVESATYGVNGGVMNHAITVSAPGIYVIQLIANNKIYKSRLVKL